MAMRGEVRQVGPYVLGRTLGSGGFASVREATHARTKERVAIKIIERNALNSDEQIKREITLCKMLQHRNVVSYKAHFVTERCVYLALELVTGGELYDQLEQSGTFLEAKAREMFKQLIDGVAYCHARGICHRDLKLENLLLGADGTVKITDLGLSTQFSTGSPKTVVGTALYVAPEVVIGDGREQYSGEAADTWSMGIILYLLTAGRFPFNRGHVGGVGPGMSRAARERFRNDKFRVLPQFSTALASLLRRVLCADPARRATIDEIKQHEWYTGVKPGAVTANPTVTEPGGELSPVSTPPRPPTPATPVSSFNQANVTGQRLFHDRKDEPEPTRHVAEALSSDACAAPPVIDDEISWDLILPIHENDATRATSAFASFGDDDDSIFSEDDEPWESAEETAWHAVQARNTTGNRHVVAGQAVGAAAVSPPPPPYPNAVGRPVSAAPGDEAVFAGVDKLAL